ncbi:MAG: glycine oxidase ThiO [Acidobacteria bacterium RIFCSPLOWO2_02_FULL_68_18]|nr:MAG: glycine oxidase ThiO [Acidobacteria bacterium RIFCSPLOWO2_02_FULL_68_18]OFW50838.1 MAG: glycine oxidase ThiO [Acidobacteria bacterium RIFCSPLOWO2_12_FULL_68_19]
MQVIVVGAGVVGCAIAYELAARGAAVRVIDPRGSGQGATRASAGMLAPYIEGHSAALLQLGVAGLDQYERFIGRVSADARRSIEYRRTGTLQVARTDEEARALERHGRALADSGVTATMLDQGELSRSEPALTTEARAALLIPPHGYVRVAALMEALVGAGVNRGVQLVVARARRIAHLNGRAAVETAEATLDADAVVLAAGSWSGGIPVDTAPSPPVRPVRGQILQLRLPQPPLSRIVWGSGGYMVPWEDGSVLVGSTAEEVGFDESVTADGVRRLLERAERLVPALGGAVFEGARAGLRPASTDELPIIGPSKGMPGVFYATGHYRNGVLLAPLTASLVADLVLGGGERPELQLVRPDRFGL